MESLNFSKLLVPSIIFVVCGFLLIFSMIPQEEISKKTREF